VDLTLEIQICSATLNLSFIFSSIGDDIICPCNELSEVNFMLMMGQFPKLFKALQLLT
jgi:hypothetical protein